MRTLVIIVAGVILLGLFLGMGKLLSRRESRAYAGAFWTFVVIWAVAAGVNMWIGVAQAGYSFMEELPIFVLIFLVPVVPGYFIQRHLQARNGDPYTRRRQS